MLEALANELPKGTINSSKVVAIEESGFSQLIHLADGTIIRTKVTIKSGIHYEMKYTFIVNFRA